MGIETNDRGGGLVTNDRGHFELAFFDDGAPVGGSACIDAGAGLTATKDPITGCMVLAATGGGGVTRQNVYDAQAGTVTTTKAAALDVGPGFAWSLLLAGVAAFVVDDAARTVRVGAGATGLAGGPGYYNDAGPIGTGFVGSEFARGIKVETEFGSDLLLGFHLPISGRVGLQSQTSDIDVAALNLHMGATALGGDVLIDTVSNPGSVGGNIWLRTGDGATPGLIELSPGPQTFPLVVEKDPGGTGAPSLDRGIAGFLGFMRSANNPQQIWGAAAGTGSGFLDIENDRPLLLQNLHTGETVIGQGGLMGENSVTDIGRSQNANAGTRFRDLLLSRGVGAFGATPPTTKPTITGSRGGNAALASLLTALAATGLIADGTTA